MTTSLTSPDGGRRAAATEYSLRYSIHCVQPGVRHEGRGSGLRLVAALPGCGFVTRQF